MKTLETLPDHKIGQVTYPKTKAWQLIEDPRCWCKGRPQSIYHDRVARCALGAIDEAYRGDFPGQNDAMNRLSRELIFPGSIFTASIAYWNDHSNHETVLSTMKRLDI